MKRIHKHLLIVSAIILGITLCYSLTWLYFYRCVCLPHVKNSNYSLDVNTVSETNTKFYEYTDELGDCYMISIPKFGSFTCGYSTCSSYVSDCDITVIDQNGNETFLTYTLNGSEFAGNVIAYFGISGKVEYFIVIFGPVQLTEDNADVYAEYTRFYVLEDGTLLNEDELSSQEYAIYKDGYDEMMRLINNLIDVFNII